MPKVPYCGRSMFYQEAGEGPVLIFLHGNTASSRLFEPLLPLYTPHFRCVLLDFLGNGRSDRVESFPADLWQEEARQALALIRAAGYDILSTHRGYRLNEGQQVSRVFQVRHTDAQIEEELFTIVDLGGRVKNVMVDHQVYGQVRAPLRISSRRTASAFLEEIHSGKSSPLKHLTSDYHYHLIQADSEDTLDLIQEALHEKGFLISVAAEGEEGTACGDA